VIQEVESMPDNSCNIGFVSTRFQGNDGVSLETEKWLDILLRMNFQCFLFGGDCDEQEIEYSYLVPEAHFKHPDIQAIYNQAFTLPIRSPDLSRQIQLHKDHLKAHLYQFVKRFSIQLLIIENALTIPLNLPLGVAITEFIAETGIPTIAHHHDFFWERKHFLVNCVWDYLNMAFPPHLPSIHHVVINSSGANQLALRTGISAMLIPNVMDFDNPPPAPDDYTGSLRADMGVASDEYFILQPTRIVQRKGIEHAIEMLHRLGKKSRLVISHASGDEGDNYESRVRNYAQLLNVPTNFVTDLIRDQRGVTEDGSRIYTLWDTYQQSDFVTYPSTIEGFGNAFLEAIYFRKPIMVNNYSIFSIDIKPKGFRVVEFDGYITDSTVENVNEVLENPTFRNDMVEHNFHLGRQYYSYKVLARRLETLLSECLGEIEC